MLFQKVSEVGHIRHYEKFARFFMGKESERMWCFQEKEMSERLLTKDGSKGGRKEGGRFSWAGTILILVVLILLAAGCATDMARPHHIPKGLEEHFRDEMQQS